MRLGKSRDCVGMIGWPCMADKATPGLRPFADAGANLCVQARLVSGEICCWDDCNRDRRRLGKQALIFHKPEERKYVGRYTLEERFKENKRCDFNSNISKFVP